MARTGSEDSDSLFKCLGSVYGLKVLCTDREGSGMFSDEFNPVRLSLVAFIGALILEIILTFATGLKEAFTVREIPTHLAALLVGALAGLVFELFRVIISTTRQTLSVATEMQASFETLTTKIKYQDEALGMLLKCPRHNDVLTRLVKASISDNFRNIPLVGVPSYLDFLRSAIVHSDGYEGIQRKPLSWFRDSGGGAYLNELKHRSMHFKTRLIILDEVDLAQWETDLKDKNCLDYYWRHTGNVSTYWMTAESFLANFPNWQTVPRDLALYDRQLVILYDERTRILSFDVLDSASRIVQLFQSIEQLSTQKLPALHKLDMPEDLSDRYDSSSRFRD